MGDAGVIALQRHLKMRYRRRCQNTVERLRHHLRPTLGVGKIACLHTGMHEHMRIMADKRPVERCPVELRQKGHIRLQSDPAAVGCLGVVTEKRVDMRRHVMKVASIRRSKRLKAARRGQRPLRRWRHLLDMDIEMEDADMVRPGPGQRPRQRGLDFRHTRVRVRGTGVNIIELPWCQHDLGVDIESGDIGIGTKPVINLAHGVGIGAFPRRHGVAIRHLRLGKADGQRRNQCAHFRGSGTGARLRLGNSDPAGRQHIGFLSRIQPVPGQIHERAAGNGNCPPAKREIVILIHRSAKAVDRLFMVEPVEPSKPARKPCGGSLVRLQKGWAVRSGVKRIVDQARIHAPTLICFHPIQEQFLCLCRARLHPMKPQSSTPGQGGKEVPVKAGIARLQIPDLALHHLMKTRQRMKRHRRKTVMFGVKRHVPGQKAHRRGGQQRTAVRQHVVIPLGASGMFGQQIGTKEGLPDQQRQQQVGDKPSGERQRKPACQPRRQHQPRFRHNPGPHHIRYIGIAPLSGRIAKKHPQIAAPERYPAQIQKIASDALRLG